MLLLDGAPPSNAKSNTRLSKQMERNMRAFTSVFGVLLLLVSWNGSARADLLVASFDSFQVLRYDDTTGAFLGTFATGLPNDRPSGMTVGADGNLYVGMNNFGPPFQSFIRRFNGQTGAFIDTFAFGGGLSGPGRLVFGPDGNLYVASFGGIGPNSKVIRYNGITGAFIDDFVPVGSGGLSGAEGLVFGPDGNLYVTSRVTNQVLRYDGLSGAFLGVFAAGGKMAPSIWSSDRRGTCMSSTAQALA
jgi:DNA-binding beta-propeller fold protein YncE